MFRTTRIASGAAVLAALAAAPPAAAVTTLAPHTTIANVGSPAPQNAGDLNGDGREDLLLASGGSCLGDDVPVVFGADAPGSVDVRALGSRGVTIADDDPRYHCREAQAVGDVNGDGRDDLAISGVGSKAFVVFGRAGGGTVTLSSLGSAGITFELGDTFEGVDDLRISRVGDVNGDGRDDLGLGGLVFTSPGADQPVTRAAAVVFGGSRSGTVDLRRLTTLPGLLLYEGPTAWSPILQRGEIHGVGDVDRDGRDDVVVEVATSGSPAHLVLGRATSGAIVVTQPGAATPLPFGGGGIDPARAVGDLNGDGVQDLEGLGSSPFRQVALSDRAATPPFTLRPADARRLAISASLGSVEELAPAGDRTGDGRDDLLATAAYGPQRTTFITQVPVGVRLSYLVHGPSAPASLDLRKLPVSAGVRLDAIPDGKRAVAGLRFNRASARGQVAAAEWFSAGGDGSVIVYDVVDRPAPPADTAAPALGVELVNSVIRRTCSFLCTSEAYVDVTVTERAYVELEIRRGTTLISATRGTIAAGAGSYTIDAQGNGTQRLATGVYTVRVVATDLAGNKTAAKTATFLVV